METTHRANTTKQKFYTNCVCVESFACVHCVSANKAKQSPFIRATEKAVKSSYLRHFCFVFRFFHLRLFFFFFWFYYLLFQFVVVVVKIFVGWEKYLSLSRQTKNGFVVCQFCRDILQPNPTIYVETLSIANAITKHSNLWLLFHINDRIKKFHSVKYVENQYTIVSNVTNERWKIGTAAIG